MYKVTYIGKAKLETKNLNEIEFENLARNLKVEPFDLIRGIEPCFVVKRIADKKENVSVGVGSNTYPNSQKRN